MTSVDFTEWMYAFLVGNNLRRWIRARELAPIHTKQRLRLKLQIKTQRSCPPLSVIPDDLLINDDGCSHFTIKR